MSPINRDEVDVKSCFVIVCHIGNSYDEPLTDYVSRFDRSLTARQTGMMGCRMEFVGRILRVSNSESLQAQIEHSVVRSRDCQVFQQTGSERTWAITIKPKEQRPLTLSHPLGHFDAFACDVPCVDDDEWTRCV